MANNLSFEKQVQIISSLAEDAGIRAIERMTGVHRDTIMRLGRSCRPRLLPHLGSGDAQLELRVPAARRDLGLHREEAEERQAGRIDVGDAWTFIAIDAKSKAVPCFKVGKRDSETAKAFVCDLSSRLANRVQISTDALAAYVEAIEEGLVGASITARS